MCSAGVWCFAEKRASDRGGGLEALSKVLTGSQYREAARKVSRRMQARKHSPLQEAGGTVQPLMLTPDQDVHASRQMLAMASLSISSSCLIRNPVRVI